MSAVNLNPTTKANIAKWFPGTTSPFICSAPMFGFANANLAVAVSKAGGFGFIGGGADFSEKSSHVAALTKELSDARNLFGEDTSGGALQVGVGFLTFNPVGFVENVVPLLCRYRVAAVWLFAPKTRDQHAGIIPALKQAGKTWDLRVFVQVGNVQAAREAVEDGCDVLVAQGTDAGGHQWAQGASVVSLVPEIMDMLVGDQKNFDVPVVAAGGISDGRGIAAALALGAVGVVMGTRFCATEECPAPVEIKKTLTCATDGGMSTIKSVIHDKIQGTDFWPPAYDGRAIVGLSYNDHLAGLSEQDNITRYNAAKEAGLPTRRTVWAGTGVGLFGTVVTASEVVQKSQKDAKAIIERLSHL